MFLLERARATLRVRLGGRAPGSVPPSEASSLLHLALLCGDAAAAAALRGAALTPFEEAAAARAASPAPPLAPPPPPPPPPRAPAAPPLLQRRAAALQRALLLPAAASPPPAAALRRRSALLRDVSALLCELREGGLAMNDALAAGNVELDGAGEAVEGNLAAVERANAALQREDTRAWRHVCVLCSWILWAVLAFFGAYVAVRVLPRPPPRAPAAPPPPATRPVSASPSPLQGGAGGAGEQLTGWREGRWADDAGVSGEGDPPAWAGEASAGGVTGEGDPPAWAGEASAGGAAGDEGAVSAVEAEGVEDL
jgi:hypothetical protein